ncbi:MAG: ABC-2 family transporter protein [Candidatus Doudnabacteria bacterium]|nr:ABC-2 family transporter protein [Candidatus Doudnabacteria bacterium]
MIKYLKIYKLFFKNSLALLASHRFNLLMSAIANIVWTFGQIVSLQFLFTRIDSFEGWSINDMVLLLGFGQLFVYIMFVLYFNNHGELQTKILEGELDTLLLKPVSTQFFISFQNVLIAQIIPLFIAVAPLIVIGIRDLRALSVHDVLFSIIVLLIGMIVMYLLSLSLSGLNFFTDNATAIRDMVMNTTDMSRIPLTFFPNPIQLVFVFFIPLAFVTYYPTLILKSPQNMFLILGLEIFTLIVFYFISQFIWKKGLQRYSGVA